MVHPLVTQLRFARMEFVRALDGISEEEARRRVPPINSLSWMVGHLAWHERLCWLVRGQGRQEVPHLDAVAGYGAPASTPPLAEMWDAWRTVVALADPYLDGLTTGALQERPAIGGRPLEQTVGTMLLRVTYHYWFHIGESQAVRQLLGHTGLPDFVGDIQAEAPYVPE
jgi:hypothetical protein